MEKPAAIRLHLFCWGLLTLLWSARFASADEIAGQDLTQGGFGRSAPVLAALEKYRRDNGTYPTQEQQLTPRYLPDHLRYGVYRRTADGSFALTFGYTRGTLPGLTVWTYHSARRKWVHSGYY